MSGKVGAVRFEFGVLRDWKCPNTGDEQIPSLYVIYGERHRANSELPMCEKCVEIDGKIEHYRQLSGLITDQPTLDGINRLIEQMEAEKQALHPEQADER